MRSLTEAIHRKYELAWILRKIVRARLIVVGLRLTLHADAHALDHGIDIFCEVLRKQKNIAAGSSKSFCET